MIVTGSAFGKRSDDPQTRAARKEWTIFTSLLVRLAALCHYDVIAGFRRRFFLSRSTHRRKSDALIAEQSPPMVLLRLERKFTAVRSACS